MFRFKKKENTQRQQPMTAEGKRQMRRRQAQKRLFFRSLLIIVGCVLLVFVWQNWDWLAPDKLVASLADWLDGGDGSYPVELFGAGAQRLTRTEDYTVLLTESHLVYYDEDGAEVNRYHCAFPSGLVRTSGDYVLLAEQGGRRLHLSTRSDIELELQADREILSVALNEKGQFAVLTKGPQGYQVQVKIYDRKGKVLYTRSRNRTATDVALSPDGKQVSLLSIEANDGNLNTFIEAFSLSSDENTAEQTHRVNDVLLYRLAYVGEDHLVAVGEEQAVFMNADDGAVTVYRQEGKHLLGYAVGADRVALALRPYGDTGDGDLILLDAGGKERKKEVFIGDFRQLTVNGNDFLILTDRYVQKFTQQGLGGKAEVSSDGHEAVLEKEQAVVLGVSRLVAYDLK